MAFDPSDILASAAAWQAERDEQQAREQLAADRKRERHQSLGKVLSACKTPPEPNSTRDLAAALLELRAVLESHGRLEMARHRTNSFAKGDPAASHGWKYASALVASIFDGGPVDAHALQEALDRFVADVTRQGLMIDLHNDQVLHMFRQAVSRPLADSHAINASDEELAAMAARDVEVEERQRAREVASESTKEEVRQAERIPAAGDDADEDDFQSLIPVWPPDNNWHFRDGEAAFRGKIKACSGKRLAILIALGSAANRQNGVSVGALRKAANYDVQDDKAMQMQISKLRKWLREHFGFEGDPITSEGDGKDCVYTLNASR